MARNSLMSPIEAALAKAPSFGLPEGFQAPAKQVKPWAGGEVPFQSIFDSASKKQGVPVNVLMALAQQESDFDPVALGQPTKFGQAKGIMQYIDSTASGLGINPYDPEQAINAAAKQLRERLDKGYSMDEAVSAHFGGDDRTQWGSKTRAYSPQVMQRAQNFGDYLATLQTPQQPQQAAGSPGQRDYAAEFPAAQSAMENMQQNELRTAAIGDDKLLADMNKDEPGRFRLPTAEETAKFMQSQQEGSTPPAAAKKEENKGDPNANIFTDIGNLLDNGLTIAAQDVTELVGKIPMVGKPIVNAMDRFDRWANNGKGTEELNKLAIETNEKQMSPDMVRARKKMMVVEPGDINPDGSVAKEWSFGPAWSDPYFYISGIAESLPEMGLTMGGAGRLAKMAYSSAIKGGLGAEVAAARAARTATVAGGFLEGGLGGAQSSRKTREEIMGMTKEQLKDSTAMKSLMDGGKSFEDARKEIAENAASKAFLLAGVGTGIFGGMGDRALAKIITGQAGGRLKASLMGAIGEGLFEELPQSTLQQMAENYAMQEADPKQKLMKGVANAAASGAAIGGLMGAGMGAAAPRTRESQQSGPEVDPDVIDGEVVPPAPEDGQPVPPTPEDVATAAAPSASRDDTGLSADAGAIERAMRGNAQQPDNSNGNFWAGEPGSTINISPKGDDSLTRTVNVEAYGQNGTVIVRDEGGTPYEITPADVDITPVGGVTVDPQLEAQQAGTDEAVLQQRQQEGDAALATVEQQDAAALANQPLQDVQPEAQQADTSELNDNQRKALQQITSALRDVSTDAEVNNALINVAQQLTGTSRTDLEDLARRAREGNWPEARMIEDAVSAHADRPLTAQSEEELRDRVRYLARQAKQSGWTDMLTRQRKEVEKVLNAKVSQREQAEKEGNADGKNTTQETEVRNQTGQNDTTGRSNEQPGIAVAQEQQPDNGNPVLRGQEPAAQERSERGAVTGLESDVSGTSSSTGNRALTNDGGDIKWFASRENAEKHIAKRRLNGYEVVEVKPKRFEIHQTGTLTNEDTSAAAPKQDKAPVSGTAPGAKKAQTPVNPRTNRAKKLVGDVGQVITPDGDVGNLTAGGQYQITRIEKNGTIHVTNSETQGSTTITPAEMERARSRGVQFARKDVTAPATSSTAAERAVAVGGETIPYRTVSFDPALNGGVGGKVESTGTSPIINFGDRMMVLTTINGRKVPFYLSTGKGGKKDVAAGQWYPFFGIGKDGWINKTGGQEMADYYGSAELRQKAQELDKAFSGVNFDNVPKVSLGGAHIDAINAAFPNATDNGTAETLNNVRKSIDDVVKSVSKKEPAKDGEWVRFDDDSGTLLVPRDQMPQIKAEHRGALVNFLEARGVEHWEGMTPADTLKPTQAEFSPERVARAAERTEGDRSILVSSDGYVVDGHHQWLAARDARDNVKAIILDAPVSKLLPLLHEFPSSLIDTASASGTAKSETKLAKPASEPQETAIDTEKYAAERVISQRDVNDRGDGRESPWLFPDGRIIGSNGDHISLSDAFGHDGYRDMSMATGAIRAQFNKSGNETPFVSLQLFDDQKLTPEQYRAVESFVKANDANISIGVDRTGRNTENVAKDEVSLETLRNEHTASNEGAKPEVTAPEYGANNKLVSQDRAAELRQKLKAKFSQLNSGIDPEILAIGTELAVFHIEAGVRKFADFAKTMAADLDLPLPRLKPYLRSWYNGARDMMEDSGVSIDGMDTPDTVRAELAKLDQPEPAQRKQQPQTTSDARTTSGLDDMVSNFDAEVPTNGNVTVMGEPGEAALGRTQPADVQRTESQREAGRSTPAGSEADGRGNGRAGKPGDADTRRVGNDEGALSLPTGRAEPDGSGSGRGTNERSSTDRRVEPTDGTNGSGVRADRPASGVASTRRPARLFTLDPTNLGKGGPKAKYSNNVAAVKVLKELMASNRKATAEEQAILGQYVGWGGLPQAFERDGGGATKGWEKEVSELKALLTPEEYRAAAASTRNAHYTSAEIVDGMWKIAKRLGFDGGRVLEPSVGTGNFFGLMPLDIRKTSALHGVELDNITAGIAAQLYPDAKIAHMGYQEFAIPDGYFDMAIGNPPFGSEKLYDGKRKDLSGFSIHNYFFARSIDALRPGGIMTMVVTNRFMDGASDKARAYIAERAELVAAIRLPNDAFAKNAGTEVTTDIIILRKPLDDENPSSANRSWLETVDYTDKNGAVVPLNRYFVTHPENMLGEFGAFGSMYRGGDSALVAKEGQNTAHLLNEAIARLPENVMSKVERVQPESRETVRAENVREGSMFVNSDGRVMQRGGDTLGETTAQAVPFTSAKAEARVKGMIDIRDQLSRLRELQLARTSSEAAMTEARERLNKVYDKFVKSNGHINSQANKLLFRDDPTWPQISALEDNYDKGISAEVARRTGEEAKKASADKAPIFSRRTQSPYNPPTSAATASDALAAALTEKGRVDMDYMAQLYGKTPDAIVQELGDLLFNDPSDGWQTRDAYLSGNVKQKLAQAEAAAKTNGEYGRNVDALRAVQPKDIEAVDIKVKPGASWVPVQTMIDFANQITDGSNAKAYFNPVNAQWSFPGLTASAAAQTRYGTSRMNVGTILEAAAAQKAVQVFDQHADGSRTLNETETQLANDKINLVKEEWQRWLWSDDKRRTALTRMYNDQFNATVAREYDGSHLTLPGKVSDDIIKLRPNQLNFVWRMVQGGSNLADHVVGAGKTFTLIAGVMELRRLGLANKPILTVPNHLVGQWAADTMRLYPGAKVLAATKRDFEKANRRRLFARIATGDWDMVIVGHSSFGKVAVKPESEAQFIQEEIADLDASIQTIKDAEGRAGSRNVKQAEERRAKMQERLKKLLDVKNKDNSLYWDDLGIDALLLDEAHEFKNLTYTTGMRNVAGLGNPAGSQKATDLFMKTRLVRQATGGRNITFATGTPISNTMAEMYTMQRYMDYDNLRAQGLYHFDAWARMYGEVVTDWELSPSGQYKMNSRFSKFVNIPELMQSYTSFADVINRDDINRQLASQGKRLPVPKVRGGKPNNVVVERSSDQADYIGEADANGNFPEGTLVYRSEHLPKKAEKGSDNMLKIMSDARKAALDMRLIDPSLPENPDSKINHAAGSIKAIYDEWHADKGTQLVFIDLSTPKGGRGREAERIRQLVERSESTDPDIAAEAQDLLDKMSPDELLALESDFSVYDDLRQKLINRGIPEAEIAYIHDANTEQQKEALFNKVRRGDIRVLLGSTPKMGAGMNVQNRLVALHHMDVPWRPSDLEQREGRIIRQGNELYNRDPDNFEVTINRYATKQTLDSRMWQTIESKALFIEQVRKGGSSREVEDVAGEAANAAEMKAASSGNPLILEEMSLRQKIRNLESERTAHDRDQFRVRDQIGVQRSQVRTATRALANLREDVKLPRPDKFAMTVDGQTFEKRKEAGEAIAAQLNELNFNGVESAKLGNYGGFEMRADRVYQGTYVVTLAGKGEYQVSVPLDLIDPTGLSMRITNTVSDLAGGITAMETKLAESEKAIPQLEAQIKPWGKEEALADATARHREVIDQLRPSRDVAQEKAAESAPLPDTLASWKRITQTATSTKVTSDQLTKLTKLRQARDTDQMIKVMRDIERTNAENSSNPRRVLKKLEEAYKSGNFSPEGIRLARWLINKYPHVANQLELQLAQGSYQHDAGNYNIAQRLITLYSNFEGADGATVVAGDALTATHEIMHHLERMMPRDVQNGITDAWLDALSARMKEYDAQGDTVRSNLLADMVAGMYGNADALARARTAFMKGDLPYSDYQFASPSEYWAENASALIRDKANAANASWIKKAIAFVKAVMARLNELVNGRTSKPGVIDQALNDILAGKGEDRSYDMLIRVGEDRFSLSSVFQGDYQAADLPSMRSGMDPRPNLPSEESQNRTLGEWWKGFKLSDKVTDSMQKGLMVIPFRPLVEEMGRNLNGAKEYLRLKQSMDAMRNRWHAETDAVAQSWLKYRKSDPKENVELMDIMHEATLAQVDPSDSHYNSLLTPRDHDALAAARTGSPEDQAILTKAADDARKRQEWESLRARFNKISPAGRTIFRSVRDTYSKLADAYEGVLMSNMEKAMQVRVRQAERDYRHDMRRVTDEGLEGTARDAAVADAEKKLRAARTLNAWNRKARITQLRQQFEMNRLEGPYFPLARFGNLFVTVRKKATGKVESFSRFESAREQREFAELMKEDPEMLVQMGTLENPGDARGQVDANFVADIEDILADLPNAESVKDEVWQRYLETLPDHSIRKNRIHRTGRKGYTADALRAFGNSMFHGSHQLARLAHTFDMQEALASAREDAQNSKDPVRDGLVVNEIEKRHEFIMNPTGGPLVAGITQAAFIYALAASPKAAVVNLTQTVIMGIPMLAAYDGKASGAVRAANQLTRALGDFTRGKGSAEKSTRLTPDERAAMKEAYDIGLIDRSQSHDLAGVGETGVEYSAAREKVMAKLAWMFHHTERLNREVTYLAAYRMARAKGEPHKSAILRANDLTWKTHFDYQNTSRPRLMHSDTMKALLVFRNFTINMLFRLFRDVHQSFKGDTPEVRKEARMQLAGTTGMMMLSAGITGTWGFGIMMVLASMFMDDDKDPEAELKKEMVDALGPMMAGIVLDGVPGYATGTNLSDSIGMKDLWFRSPSTQLEGKAEAEYWKSQLLGAAPSMADNIIRGWSMIQQGDVYRGIETIMPKAIKDPMKAFRFATDGAENMRGDKIVDEVGAWDVVRQALGFSPAKLAEQYEINNAGYNLQKTILSSRTRLMTAYAKADEKGDDAAIEKVEKDIDKFNEKYPEMEISPKSLNRSILTREKNAEEAMGGMRYNRKLRDRIEEDQAPAIYR